MANICRFTMSVEGTLDGVERWTKLNDYETPNHFWRMFQWDVVEKFKQNDGTWVAIIEGQCAWSIYSCCIRGYTNVDLLALNSHDFGVRVNIDSAEPGMGFREHYEYDKGSCTMDYTTDYDEDDDDDEEEEDD